MPLYRLLGGCRDRVEAYASGGFYQEGKGVDELAGEAEGYRARGFKGMKMKIGRNPSTQTHLRHLVDHAELCEVEPEEDIARVAAVRQRTGPAGQADGRRQLRLEPGVGDRDGPRDRALQSLLDRGAGGDRRHRRQRRGRRMRLATPIAGYETEVGLYGFRELITRGAVDIVQPDIAWSGGFSECRRIAALAQAHHLMVAPHAFAGAVNAGRLIAFHRLDPERAGARIRPEPERAARRITEGAGPRWSSDGTIRLPERPGLGIELDPAAVERYRAE